MARRIFDPCRSSGERRLPEQVARLVDSAQPDGPRLAVLTFFGLRLGDLAALRVRRVNLLRHRLVIAESVTDVAGRAAWSLPKTNRTRTVPSLAQGIEGQRQSKAPDGRRSVGDDMDAVALALDGLVPRFGPLDATDGVRLGKSTGADSA